MNGYPIATEALDLELYRISCILASSRTLHEMGKEQRNLVWFLNTFEKSELSRKLISVAVIIRNMDEQAWNANYKKIPVGELIPNEEDDPGSIEPLSLREACNKIIHALEVDFYHGVDNVTEDTPLSCRIRLRGEKSSKKWLAIIDLFKFLELLSTRT
jgi:hypothetical protein